MTPATWIEAAISTQHDRQRFDCDDDKVLAKRLAPCHDYGYPVYL